ncbi:hypothetical protein [Candidatus Nitrospira nitrificans]|uniref:Uncharacterized protein n=1 Tax=Candidatus Nitrospira nitrificans TaxID=1742973 RepID=A0A0S4L9T4_9BACT|nr:hypothetical protein [Candidatus Nitrospira nitrificans]CUS34467.1 conserved hypothetical protein [Candidatus Nitrospira nitrificans]
MSCTRCQGLMLEEHMIDLEGGYGEMWHRALRCFNCGHRDDAVMRHHRQRHATPIMGNPSAVTVPETVALSRESESLEPLAA